MWNSGFLKPVPGFATAAIHVGQDPDKWSSRAIVPPNVNSSAFEQIAPGVNNGYLYGRAGNPMRNTLEECIAALDGGKHGFAFASGIGAIDTVISLLSSGDHVVCTEHVYSGTMRLLRKILSRMGISTTFTDFTDEHKVNNAIQQNTKMIWIETPTNPLMKVIDIKAIVNVTKKHCKNILVAVDNSFLTSYFQRPLDFGADIVVYSLTKYMNGHSDVIMGAAVLNDNSIAAKLRCLQSGMGSIPSPSDCYLVNRGLKTLPVRMKYHMESSLFIAKWLQDHSKVVKVNHPGLPSHPQYEISQRQTSGFSGIFSFSHCGDLKESTKFLTSLKIFSLAVSVGGYESLAELPAKMSHDTVPADELKKLGITDSLIRLSIGLEDTEDLIEDLQQAFDKAF